MIIRVGRLESADYQPADGRKTTACPFWDQEIEAYQTHLGTWALNTSHDNHPSVKTSVATWGNEEQITLYKIIVITAQ